MSTTEFIEQLTNTCADVYVASARAANALSSALPYLQGLKGGTPAPAKKEAALRVALACLDGVGLRGDSMMDMASDLRRESDPERFDYQLEVIREMAAMTPLNRGVDRINEVRAYCTSPMFEAQPLDVKVVLQARLEETDRHVETLIGAWGEIYGLTFDVAQQVRHERETLAPETPSPGISLD